MSPDEKKTHLYLYTLDMKKNEITCEKVNATEFCLPFSSPQYYFRKTIDSKCTEITIKDCDFEKVSKKMDVKGTRHLFFKEKDDEFASMLFVKYLKEKQLQTKKKLANLLKLEGIVMDFSTKENPFEEEFENIKMEEMEP